LVDPDAAREAVERLDRIDALVANAGVIVRQGVLETTLEDWRYVIDVNLTRVRARAGTDGAVGGGRLGRPPASQLVLRRLQRLACGVEGRCRPACGALERSRHAACASTPSHPGLSTRHDGTSRTATANERRIPLGRWPDGVAGAVSWLLPTTLAT
jgi:hypothetical protein